ncbi:insulinase family protein [Brevundimonas sp. 2R-24]|uniref:Insulinase family protein n=1 Tax=Peiella sedimenti TaxID=3061083 RepID=A0ABT8SIA5_9CAUL|nr:insulinase family protein [Caulobacteraceae bacterium XZ-24]
MIKNRMLAAASALALLTASPALAALQQAPAPAASSLRPFQNVLPHERSDLAPDPAVRFGRLPNGMRYAIMHNETPPNQGVLRLRVDAGSLMERDDQRGLAHFMEHMVFNGTTGIPEGQLLPILERLGLQFGADTNAVTGFESTTYQLDLPRTNDETVDTSLRVMREMMGEALLDADAIDRERGIILSEERTRATPGLRGLIALIDFVVPGQLVTQRLPIGTTESLRTADRQKFVDFYRGYYRPERATLIAVGDFDVDAMEAKIRSTFSSWEAVGPAGPEPDLGALQPRQIEARIFSEPGASSNVQIFWSRPLDWSPDTAAKRSQDLVTQLGFAVLNRRLGALARGAEPPFIGAGAGEQDLFESAELTSLSATIQPGQWASALAALDEEQRRIVQYGVRADELAREVSEFHEALRAAAARAGTRPSTALANGLVGSLEEQQVFTAPQADLELFESVAATVTPEAVNAALAAAFTGNGPLVFLNSPQPVEGGEAAVLEAYQEARERPVAAGEAQAAVDWAYTDFGQPGQVAERTELDGVGATAIRFANGVRLTVKPTDFTDNQVLVALRLGQGYQGLPTDRVPPTWAAPFVLGEGGLGRMTQDQVEQALTGKLYGLQFAQTDDAYRLSGSTRPEDLLTQMQVMAAYVTDPGWRPEPLARSQSLLTQQLDQLRATPAGVFALEAGHLLRGGDQRWALPNAEQIAATQMSDIRGALEPQMSNGPVEITIVGDVTVEDAIAAVASTFGALPARGQLPAIPAGADQVSFPQGAAQPVTFTHGGRADQALGFVAWPTTDYGSDTRESRAIQVLGDVMRLRLIEELREGQAVTYSPNVGTTASWEFPGYGYVSASIQVPPERLEGFFGDVDRIAASLVETPITADELERARRPRIENLLRQRNQNGYWVGQLDDVQSDPRTLPSILNAQAELEALTPADIQAVAQRYLRADRAWRAQAVPAAGAAGGE